MGKEITTEGRLTQLGKIMAIASQMMTEVQAELTAQHALAKQLAEEIAEGKQLAALNEESRAAVASVVRAEVEKGGKRALWQSALISFGFFVAGAAVTLGVTLYIHPLWS